MDTTSWNARSLRWIGFVGLEIQQTQRIAIAGQVQARPDTQLEILLTPLEGDERRLVSKVA